MDRNEQIKIINSQSHKESIPEKINYLNPEILNVKKYTYEQLMEQTDDEKIISDDAELYSNDDFKVVLPHFPPAITNTSIFIYYCYIFDFRKAN